MEGVQCFNWKRSRKPTRSNFHNLIRKFKWKNRLPAEEGDESFPPSVWHALATSFIASLMYGREMFDPSKSLKVLCTLQINSTWIIAFIHCTSIKLKGLKKLQSTATNYLGKEGKTFWQHQHFAYQIIEIKQIDLLDQLKYYIYI